VLRGGAVHDGVQPRFELPGALPRGDDEGLAAEPGHARLERGKGTQRGIEEYQAQNFAGQRLRLRPVLQRLREREQVEHLFAAEIGEVEKAVHAGIFARASHNRST
jgi:hypothetical protein